MAKLDFFKIGKIVKTKGLRGEFKVYSHTDNIERFYDLEEIYIGDDRETKYRVEKINIDYSKNMITMKLVGFDKIEDIERYINRFIYVDRSDAYQTEDDEYFIDELIGLEVYTEAGEKLGLLTDVLKYMANDVYVVTSKEKKEYLIPATYEAVPEIDIENGKMIVHLMPGLID